jgi:hypothetical protein
MSKDVDPSKPTSNAEKFKPQNVADESAGDPNSPGRLDRDMAGTNTARGSEVETRSAASRRG